MSKIDKVFEKFEKLHHLWKNYTFKEYNQLKSEIKQKIKELELAFSKTETKTKELKDTRGQQAMDIYRLKREIKSLKRQLKDKDKLIKKWCSLEKRQVDKLSTENWELKQNHKKEIEDIKNKLIESAVYDEDLDCKIISLTMEGLKEKLKEALLQGKGLIKED